MMIWKKCNSCDRRIRKSFNFCPHCGNQTKKIKKEDYGMLGQNDFDERTAPTNELKLPFGLNGIFNTLIKQLEQEMNGIERNNNSMKPKGFKIQISTGMPPVMEQKDYNEEIKSQKPKTISAIKIDEKEKKRRANLERSEAKSVIRRLPEGIFYEIDTPGVNSINDVVITKLEGSLEVKAYSVKKCYVKNIPMKFELVGFSVKNEKVFLKFKG